MGPRNAPVMDWKKNQSWLQKTWADHDHRPLFFSLDSWMNSFMNSFMNSLDWLCTNPSHLLLVLAQKTQFQHGFPNQPIIPLGKRHRSSGPRPVLDDSRRARPLRQSQPAAFARGIAWQHHGWHGIEWGVGEWWILNSWCLMNKTRMKISLAVLIKLSIISIIFNY